MRTNRMRSAIILLCLRLRVRLASLVLENIFTQDQNARRTSGSDENRVQYPFRFGEHAPAYEGGRRAEPTLTDDVVEVVGRFGGDEAHVTCRAYRVQVASQDPHIPSAGRGPAERGCRSRIFLGSVPRLLS